QELRGTKLILAGRINEAEEVNIRSKFTPNVKYVGMKSGDELRQLIGRCRAVVVPSIWYENQPFSILEAFAAGKPVIASNLGGMSELVAHMERGLLVKPNNSQELASAMDWMDGHPKEARKMGASAQEFVEKEHSAEHHYEKIISIYNRVLEVCQ
ncbi:MAG TPA: glycosyltransferase family 4 protein, partial [Candidatus Hodarchaeales archaeon]|nr:glycosyltransferase family 4 protein [Candidatus Hodarchaeales archaeon]